MPEAQDSTNPAEKRAEESSTINFDKLIEAVSPHANEYISALIEIGKQNTAFSARAGAYLLGLVICAFTGLAFYAISAGHVDMAEKVVIALISFLSGAALFGHGKK